MKRILLVGLLSLLLHPAYAQKRSPLFEAYFSRPDAMEQDEDGGYHFTVDGGNKVSMSDDGYYKLMTREGTVLEEGDTDEGDDAFVRHGKWTEYHSDGKPKATGSYFRDMPYGQWQFFDMEGRVREQFTIVAITASDGSLAYCKAGTELVFYDNGKVKEERYFRAEPYDGEDRVRVDDVETGKSTWKKVAVKQYKPVPFGTWIYYKSDGSEERREDKSL